MTLAMLMLPLCVALPLLFWVEIARILLSCRCPRGRQTFRRALVAAILVVAETGVMHEEHLPTGTNEVHQRRNIHVLSQRSSVQHMKHRKKRKGKRGEKPMESGQQLEDDVVEHSAAVLSCATEAADEFVGVCERSLETLEDDLAYLRLGLEIWAEHPQLARPLRVALQELLQVLTAHCKSLTDIKQELERLAADPAPHIHLDPVERYHQLVRERLFGPQAFQRSPHLST
jgi:hypothetical protein